MGRELSALIVKDVIGWFALARGDGTGVLRIPSDSGGIEVVKRGQRILMDGTTTYGARVVQVLAELADRKELIEWWCENLPARKSARWFRWMLVGVGLDVLREVSDKDLLQIFGTQECDVLDQGLLYRGAATRIGLESAACGLKMLEYLKTGIYQQARFFGSPNILDLSVFLFYDGLYDTISESQFALMLRGADSAEHLSSLKKILTDITRRSQRRRLMWGVDASEVVKEYFGPCWLATRFSVLRFFWSGVRQTDDVMCGLLDVERSLADRLAAAVGKRADARWWEECIGDQPNADDAQLLLTALICIADEDVISRCLPLLSSAVDRWSPEQIIGTIETIIAAGVRQTRLNARQVSTVDVDSPVLLAAVAARSRVDQRQRTLSAAIGRSSDERVRLYLAEYLLDGCIMRIANTGRWVGTRDTVLEYGPMLAAHRYGVPTWRTRELRADRVMDEAVASEVLGKPELYPVEVVLLADQSASRRAARSAPLVSAVAVEDSWFDQDQPF